ncbi:MAG: hypothetical protein AAF327_24610 [Cyanobacteria bacterium P01_A01_bin.37]
MPNPDVFSEQSRLDLRDLNESSAGESGFIRLSDDGRNFVTGNNVPIRFWAVNSHVWKTQPDKLTEHARFLAKRGVNMVRWHGHIPAVTDGSALTSINEQARDQLWRYVAAMKQSGIYVTISPYYALRFTPLPGWNIPRDSKKGHGLLFFDPVLQEAYREWLRLLLEPVNPYTGVPLKDESAIAIIQLQNEDSLLFWTIQDLRGRDLDILSQQYGQWLIEKYGSLENTRAAWQQTILENDDFERELIRFYHVWEMTQPPPSNSGKAKRLADQTQFWTETMHRFNTETVQFLRDEVGAQQLTSAGNWKTASPLRLNDAERYSYTASDVIGVNRYYGGTHIGEDSNWAILNGQRFTDQSVLFNPLLLPTNLKQVVGHPMIISESSWVPPLSYQSESPFLVSVFQSLTGVDGFYWFATTDLQWRQPSSANQSKPSLGKWVISTPELLGNFPAAALMYRKGYIQQGTPVIQEHRHLDDLWQRHSPLISEALTFDPNRDRESSQNLAEFDTEANPFAFLVGPVEVSYGEGSEPNMIADVDRFIDEDQHRIHSMTREVTWDYEKGTCTLNAPKAQGVAGFLRSSGGEFELDDVTLNVGNDYATVMVVSMDDQAIDTSNKLLVQVGTRARSTGWNQQAVSWEDDDGNTYEGYEILNYGEAPWKIENNDVTLTVKNSKLTSAFILDMNGMLKNKIELESNGPWRRFRLPTDAKYIILE